MTMTREETLRWFMGRAGDHIDNGPYQELVVELANELFPDRNYTDIDQVIKDTSEV